MPTLLLIDETVERAHAEARRMEGQVEGLRVRCAASFEEGAAVAEGLELDLALIFAGPAADPARLCAQAARLRTRLGSVVLGDELPAEVSAARSLVFRTGDLDWLAGLVKATSGLAERAGSAARVHPNAGDPGFDRHHAVNQLAAILSGLRAMEVALKAEAAPATADSLARRLSPVLEATRQLSAAICAPGSEEVPN